MSDTLPGDFEEAPLEFSKYEMRISEKFQEEESLQREPLKHLI